MDCVFRRPDGGLVGLPVEIELDFVIKVPTAGYGATVIPDKGLADLDEMIRDLFHERLLIDNNDPYADDLMKLKRAGLAHPTLFDAGTNGPALSFFVGRKVETWLAGQPWNPKDDESPHRIQICLSTVQVGGAVFLYDLT
jgi:hypothetical protein